MPRKSLSDLKRMKQAGEKIVCLTAYDASFAAILDESGVDVMLVGDSLGMVIQGHSSTIPVTVDDIVYHTRHVCRGAPQALVIADMPFMANATPEQTLHNAGRLMQEGGAHIVKLEGGYAVLDTVQRLSNLGVPVCGHIGLQPQSVNKLGGYKVQGKQQADAERLLAEAKALEQAGADLLVLECIPAGLGRAISQQIAVPTIGIGAGVHCDGQVLVTYDMLGITPGKRPRFSHDFLAGRGSVKEAVQAFVSAVKQGHFPTLAQSY